MTRNLHRGFCFEYKNITKKEYWIERGWSELEAIDITTKDKAQRAIRQSETRQKLLQNKDVFIEDGKEKEYKFISGTFISKNKPKCNICDSELILKKVNINNESDNFYYKIIKCSNKECKIHKSSKNDKYTAYLPEKVSIKVIGDIANNIRKKNRLSIESWINKGYSEIEANNEVCKIQSENSKKRKNPFIPTRENLKKYGYTEVEINEICLTPTQVEFWFKNGLSEEKAKEKVSELQRKKMLNFIEKRKENPDEYSAVTHTQLAYWINKGLSEGEAKLKLKERQHTFSMEKCIEKYGEEDGRRIFVERQNKWQKSLLENGNLKCGYSKISQELFDEIIKHYDLDETIEVFYATRNKEYYISKLNNEFYQYDFVDIKKKKIIEYNGDQFHANPGLFTENDHPNPFRKELTSKVIWEKDKNKKNAATEKGFEVLVIWDSEYRLGNKQEVINKCLEFLEIKK